MSTVTIALAGCPNSGKSALFNALTGSRQKVGNYPGVTVEKKEGFLQSTTNRVKIIDLPGTYSLSPHSLDEEIAVKCLLEGDNTGDRPLFAIVVADAVHLERTLGIALELKKMNKLGALVLNMMDLAAKRHLLLNLKALSEELAVPVIPTVAVTRSGIEQLQRTITQLIDASKDYTPQPNWQPPTSQDLMERSQDVSRIISRCTKSPSTADIWSNRLDKILLHRFWGLPILATVLFVMFQAVFSWAETPMDLIEQGIMLLSQSIEQWLPEGLLASLLIDGIISGVGAVIVFLPQIVILFFFIFIFEASGYMMRAAFLLDRMMAAIGLRGRSFVPLLSSFACAIPGIMATRTIKSKRIRLLTMMISPLMTCSARLPVYILLIGAFIPPVMIGGVVNLQGITMFGLFCAGVLAAIIVAWMARLTQGKNSYEPNIYDLPTYKWPHGRQLLTAIWGRVQVFLRRAGTIILGVSAGLWFLSSFPQAPEDWEEPDITYSYAGRIGQAIEPLVRPLGFDWRIATGIIPGFAAREVMVGALGTVFSIEDADESGFTSLQDQLRKNWSLATGLSLLVWYIFAPQCLATFAAMRKESDSWKIPLLAFSYLLGLAYFMSWLTFRVVSFFS